MAVTVLHVIEALETGVARHVGDLIEFAEGVRHHVAAPSARVGGMAAGTDDGALERFRAAGAVVHRVEMRRLPLAGRNIRAIGRIRRLATDHGVDVVHGHSAIGGALARVAARGSGRVYTPNGLLTSAPVVAVERVLGRRTDRLVATSPSEADLVRRLRLVDPERVVTIRNGIPIGAVPQSPLDLRAHLGLPPGAPLVGAVGRLVPQKAPLDFIAACRLVAPRLPGAHFVLVGNGPLAADVGRASETDAVLRGRLHAVGHVPGAAGVLPQLDVCVQASRYEGGPYVPLEAMAAGTPVVVSDAVGNRDLVEPGVSGLVVPVGDVVALGDAISRVLEDAELSAALAAAATERLHSLFDVRAMARATVDLYREVAAAR